jgi:hypothetical protein
MRDDGRELLSATALPLHDGHGGGDDRFMADLIARLTARRAGKATTEEARTSLAASVESHLMAFAAEESRRERRMIELEG